MKCHSKKTVAGLASSPDPCHFRGMKKPLREGFTTGTATAAAAKAAVALLLGGGESAVVSVPLPPFALTAETAQAEHDARLDIPIASLRLTSAGATGPDVSPKHLPGLSPWAPSKDSPCATATVIKDGGDDPDATHGAALTVYASTHPFLPDGSPFPFPISPQTQKGLGKEEGVRSFPYISLSHFPNPVFLYAGKGIGTVTLPGLPVVPGEPAINPQPRLQIAAAACEAAGENGYDGPLHILVTVPDGEERARKTMNARLGILGGISILGTRGTVRPYSHEAWTATILQGFQVAAALGLDTVLLATGRRSERALFGLYPHLPPTAGIQAADFAAFSLKHTAALPFARVVWGCFPGKLLKLAQGLEWTHASTARSDIPLLARLCREGGGSEALARNVGESPTAAGAFALMHEASPRLHDAVLARLASRAYAVMQDWMLAARAGTSCGEGTPASETGQETGGPALVLHVFSTEGEHLLHLGGGDPTARPL